ncbi:polymer-forming cytoskeletal protein [Paenibacillus hamazuiensis]|uniref:polymer-forming cytoskeletal protein n=1 Tax=Paenibacillus hamazuiensis TaxID=2936508 RepID=UPI00200EF04E|nr:polymer-forming cytoskeletal protein [Paenibacillus hamazuiensis]
MVQTANRKMKITGVGSVSGGVFQQVAIMGEGHVLGSVECESFHCTGNCSVKGAVQAERYRLLGDASIDGDLQGGELRVVGQLQVKGAVRGKTVKLDGMLQAEGTCEADRFLANGAFEINGLLNADEVNINPFGPCRAKEVGGGRITVRLKKWLAVKMWFTGEGPSGLTAETIEGDDLYLEHTKADIVRGNKVVIGPGCHIGHVEYRISLQKDGTSIVLQEEKV